MINHDRQLRAAQIAYDNLSPDDEEAEALERIYESLRDDPAKVAEADEWNDGMQSGEHYSEVERALADLHEIDPDQLLGSDVLVRLYRLAKAHGLAREEKLWEMAEAMQRGGQ